MSSLHHLKLLFRRYRIAAWRIVILVFIIILFPVLIFMPKRIINNCDKIISNFLLQILWVIWRVIKTSLLILLALIIFLLGPILWPVYLGILVLFPRFAAYIMSIKIF